MRRMLTELARSTQRVIRVILVASTAACTGWGTVEGTPGVGPGPIGRARLTLNDGSRVELRDVSLAADSMIGFQVSGADGGRAAYHVRDVARVERGELSAGRTAVLAAALAAGAVAVYYVVATINIINDPNY